MKEQERKKGKKYIPVDKSLIAEGALLDFDLFEANETKTQMSVFMQASSMMDGDSKVRLREIEALYISEDNREAYDSYIKQHIKQAAADANMPIEEKSALLYSKAAEAVETMFNDPGTLKNMERSREVVDGFVDLILHQKQAIESLMKITAHDYYTHTHSINVSIYALSLGTFMGMNEAQLKRLGIAALLHDLGKSKIDYEIINKSGRLSEEEFEVMKTHPALGYEIALSLGITDADILSGIRSHHEKFDGNGYPDGKQGREEITEFARIIGTCDVFDALTTKRSYKEPLSSFETLAMMKKQMRDHLDMKMVDMFIMMLRKSGEKET